MQLSDYDKLSSSLLVMFFAINAPLDLLRHMIQTEVDRTGAVFILSSPHIEESKNTLFRGNTLTTKILAQFATEIGKEYLRKAMQQPLKDFLASGASLEVFQIDLP